MENFPSVSVVIPTFNRPEPTLRALQSVFAQTAAADEIIVVDDGSTEPFTLPANVRELPKVRVLRLAANRGAAAARQFGLQEASGELIAFLDSDDVWDAGKLKAQFELLGAQKKFPLDPLTAVACGWRAVPESGGAPRLCVPIASASALDFASGCWFSPGTTVLVPRAAFDVVGPFDPSLRRLEDLDWFLRLALAGGQVIVTPTIGATISIGRRGRFNEIQEAGALIQRKISKLDDNALARKLGWRLRAYLDVELANAAYGEGHFMTTAAYLMRSLTLRPRTTIPLRNWWV